MKLNAYRKILANGEVFQSSVKKFQTDFGKSICEEIGVDMLLQLWHH